MTKALFLLLALSGAAQAAPHGFYWAAGRAPVLALREKAAGPLLYYGGPVISHAKVYAVFWGDAVPAETKANIGPFFQNMLDSAYMDWLSEYSTNRAAVDGRAGTGQTIGRGRYMGSITIEPSNRSARLTDAQIQAELEAQIAAGRLPPPDADTLYMTYFPAGVSIGMDSEGSCSSFCAYHEGFKTKTGAPVYYGVMPICDWGCGSGFGALTSVSSHEAIEAITDPFPTPGSHPAYPQAWNTSGGDEIADLCTGRDAPLSGHGVTSTVQALWKNSSNACFNGPWNAPAPASLARLPAALRLIPALRGLPAAPAWDGR